MGDNKTADTCSVDPSSWQVHMQQALAVGEQDVAHFLECSWPAVEDDAAPTAEDADGSWGEESACQEEVQTSMDSKAADTCSVDPSSWQLHMQQALAVGAQDVAHFLDCSWPAVEEEAAPNADDEDNSWGEESTCQEEVQASM